MKEVVITLLVAILIVFVAKNSTYTKSEPLILTHTDTVYSDTSLNKKTKGNNIPFVVLPDTIKLDAIHDTIHDTIKALNDYLAVKVFKDSFSLDSSHFTILDTISHNAIIGRNFKADIHEKTIKITENIYEQPKNEVYLGFLGDLRAFDNKLGIGIGLGYKTAKNSLFTIGATTNNYSIGVYKKF